MKIKSIIILLFAIYPAIFAQPSSRLTIAGLVGYTLQDDISFSNSYYGYIEDGAQYGGILEYRLRPTFSLGVSYTHMDTHTPIYDSYRDKVNQGSDATGLNYLMFEGIKYFPVRGLFSVVTPYAGIGAGMSIINIKSGDSYTKFAWNGKFGVKIRMTAHIAILAQAQVQSIVQGVGGSMYVGTGGASIGLSSYSSVYQFTFGGGLAFSL